MRKLVNYRHLRLPAYHRFDIKLGKDRSLILDRLERNEFKILDLLLCLETPVSLDCREDNIDSLLAKLIRVLQHPVRFSDTGSGTDVDPQSSATARAEQHIRNRP
jgi:hypothetical protein